MKSMTILLGCSIGLSIGLLFRWVSIISKLELSRFRKTIEIILVTIGLVSLPILAWYHGFMTALECMTSFLVD